MRPSVGRVVHYASLGSADGEFPPACRAAIVTDVDGDRLRLAVLNPEGLFFSAWRAFGDRPGQWHWPERVED